MRNIGNFTKIDVRFLCDLLIWNLRFWSHWSENKDTGRKGLVKSGGKRIHHHHHQHPCAKAFPQRIILSPPPSDDGALWHRRAALPAAHPPPPGAADVRMRPVQGAALERLRRQRRRLPGPVQPQVEVRGHATGGLRRGHRAQPEVAVPVPQAGSSRLNAAPPFIWDPSRYR